MTVRKLTNLDRMADMLQPCDEDFADWLVANGFTAVGRYLDDLVRKEVDILHSRHLGIVGIRESRAAGWHPNRQEGMDDSASTHAKAFAIGMDRGTSIACDLEGCSPTTTTVDATSYLVEWPKLVVPDWEPMLYVGEGAILTGVELQALPGFGLYWRSCSLVPDLPRGYVLLQTRPGDVLVGPPGKQRLIDINQPETDWHNPARSVTAWFP